MNMRDSANRNESSVASQYVWYVLQDVELRQVLSLSYIGEFERFED